MGTNTVGGRIGYGAYTRETSVGYPWDGRALGAYWVHVCACVNVIVVVVVVAICMWFVGVGGALIGTAPELL